ncbi:MAG: type IV pilus modification protein PilV [Proteobacteria bacterium]|jgi:type IV pilus assembly protein PilV|nr:type IV pilus modification protein PilV [Ramlibacter sp.]MCA0214082.1 type IV pilus modification protein PilV [Pseudomonadota bacterium]
MRRAHSSHWPAGSMRGATLIEILVSILVLSFGLLAIGNMLAYAMQLPKVAGNRAVASNLAQELIERMRANVAAFQANHYGAMTYTGTADLPATNPGNQCNYPNCTAEALAIQDIDEVSRAARMQLPSGGVMVENPGVSAAGEGRVFILWKEAASAGSLGNKGDICPALTSDLADSAPRCVMIKFRP